MKELQRMSMVNAVDIQAAGTYENIQLYCVRHTQQTLGFKQFMEGYRRTHYFLTRADAEAHHKEVVGSAAPTEVAAIKLAGAKGPIYLLLESSCLLQEPIP